LLKLNKKISRKISDFFTKKSIKAESSENYHQSAKSEALGSVKLESEENSQNLDLKEISELENQARINKNVKTETE